MNLESLPILLPVLLFSVVVHEVAHGWSALQLGDPTAKYMGRLTLNPIPHIDIFGTIILPAILIFSQTGLIFGYAKPVPVDFRYFRNPLRDQAIVSFAGPLSNILLAFAFFIVGAIIIVIVPVSFFAMKLMEMVQWGILINLILANFNLIPIPPLDGSWIMTYFLPEHLAQSYERLRPYGFFIVIALLYLNILNFLFTPALVINRTLMTILINLQ
ncbi:site-2 protease family protein [candidate division KSB1 bacterium]